MSEDLGTLGTEQDRTDRDRREERKGGGTWKKSLLPCSFPYALVYSCVFVPYIPYIVHVVGPLPCVLFVALFLFSFL